MFDSKVRHITDRFAFSQVVVSPAAVAVSPIPAASSTIDLWIIGVVLGACVIMLLLFACLYWRWKSGGPQQKLDLEKIQMTEKVNAVNKVCTAWPVLGSM